MPVPPLKIAVVGIDGAGKSTQVALLAAWLRDQGLRTAAFEHPGGRPVTDWVAHRLGRADTAALLGSRGRLAVETTVRAGALARTALWLRATRGVVVMDRCALCQYAVLRARGDRAGERLARAALGPFGLPDVIVQLTLEEAEAQRRVEARGYDREALEALQAFAAAYRALPEAPLMRAVDAGGSVDAVQTALRAEVAPFLGLAARSAAPS